MPHSGGGGGLLDDLASMLRNLASQAPVIAVLDDVHFADASSWEARGSAIVGLSGSDGGRRGASGRRGTATPHVPRCEGRPDYSDTAYYTTPSGAGVFASGTMRWVESMMAGRRGDGADHHISAAAGRFVTRVNTNLLLAFARGPAREHYPSARDNLGTLA